MSLMSILLFYLVWHAKYAHAQTDFIFKIDTEQVAYTPTQMFHLPLVSTGTYNFVVDWGDGFGDTITYWDQAETNHTYGRHGTYIITLHGTITGWGSSTPDVQYDGKKIVDVTQWGNLNMGNEGHAFNGCTNLIMTATDFPDLTGITNLKNIFKDTNVLGDINNDLDFGDWDVSGVTSLEGAFRGSEFIGIIDTWDTSNVESFAYMFRSSAFNGDITSWDTTRATTIQAMFRGADAFNQDIGSWNVAAATKCNTVFRSALVFNQDLSNW